MKLMVVSVVVGFWYVSISRLESFRIIKVTKAYTLVAFMSRAELYVCMYLVYGIVDKVHFRVVSYMINMSLTYLV